MGAKDTVSALGGSTQGIIVEAYLSYITLMRLVTQHSRNLKKLDNYAILKSYIPPQLYRCFQDTPRKCNSGHITVEVCYIASAVCLKDIEEK
jgi:hypothetical protein